MTFYNFVWLSTGFFSTDLYMFLLYSILHFVAGSIFFDLVHILAHRSHLSQYRLLRLLAKSHAIHHKYFDRNLTFNNRFSLQNLTLHLPLELLCHIFGSTLSFFLSRQLFPETILVQQDLIFVLALQIIRTCVVAWNSGHDSNHVSYKRLSKDPHFLFVGPQYHALHHLDPHNYFGSMTRLVDWVSGTAFSMRGRRVAMTGYGGALGQAFAKQLSLEGVSRVKALRFGVDWSYDNYSKLMPTLAETDILILAHGSKSNQNALRANCESVVAIIELFKRCRLRSTLELMPEVWYVGSEAELHGSWTEDMHSYTSSKRAFVPFARAYYDDDTFIYRHIVPAAFSSGMGRAIVTARWTSSVAMWWIHRGAGYVPVTYTGFAYANFFRFKYWVRPQVVQSPSSPNICSGMVGKELIATSKTVQ